MNEENEILMDGISNVRPSRDVLHVPSMETIQEFKVLTNTYDAQYGRTGGGTVSIVTKGGGNQFKGSLFHYFQAEEMNANQSELNRGGVAKPPMAINVFGFQVSRARCDSAGTDGTSCSNLLRLDRQRLVDLRAPPRCRCRSGGRQFSPAPGPAAGRQSRSMIR
ncbi:MAG: hypothetical protein M9913_20695 [Bryobacteraceae bacterium]|nr:hypothetical protein [Bryobacteraceae bacterium]